MDGLTDPYCRKVFGFYKKSSRATKSSGNPKQHKYKYSFFQQGIAYCANGCKPRDEGYEAI